MTEIAVLNHTSELEKYVDLWHIVLLRCARNTVLPDLLEVFGKEALIKFLDIFAGTTFRVPSREVLEHSVRDVDIYIQVKRHGSDAFRGLCQRYDLTEDQVKSAYYQVRDMAKGLT